MHVAAALLQCSSCLAGRIAILSELGNSRVFQQAARRLRRRLCRRHCCSSAVAAAAAAPQDDADGLACRTCNEREANDS
jgi:hypothetical protein